MASLPTWFRSHRRLLPITNKASNKKEQYFPCSCRHITMALPKRQLCYEHDTEDGKSPKRIPSTYWPNSRESTVQFDLPQSARYVADTVMLDSRNAEHQMICYGTVSIETIHNYSGPVSWFPVMRCVDLTLLPYKTSSDDAGVGQVLPLWRSG